MSLIHYAKESSLTWTRVRKGKSFEYLDLEKKLIPKMDLERINSLSIPPAWSDVVISPDDTNYIQAIGLDAKGRKQYIYHSDWIKQNQERKFDQMVSFGERLPTLRNIVKAHMREHKLSQDRVVATVVWLLEHTFIRVGNREYAKENKSYGLTTMREKHVDVKGNTVSFSFEGKSGVYHELDVTNPRVATTIRECLDLPGYEVFQYIDAEGKKRSVNSEEVNLYLQKHTGRDFSAKDFRTWGGSVLAGDAFYKKGDASTQSELQKKISDVLTEVSNHLGNTKKVCRTYYVHPIIIESYQKNILVPHFERSYNRKTASKLSLSPEEYATWSLIKDF